MWGSNNLTRWPLCLLSEMHCIGLSLMLEPLISNPNLWTSNSVSLYVSNVHVPCLSVHDQAHVICHVHATWTWTLTWTWAWPWARMLTWTWTWTQTWRNTRHGNRRERGHIRKKIVDFGLLRVWLVRYYKWLEYRCHLQEAERQENPSGKPWKIHINPSFRARLIPVSL